MSRSAYFSPQTFKFLRDIKRHNEREWFQANKPRYEEHVKEPFLRLIADLQGPLAKISAHFRADPKPVGGSLFRIYRDTRFAKDKTPYKTHAGAYFFHARNKQVHAPGFYVHIEPGQCFVGAGVWHPDPPAQKRIRDFLLNNPASWTKATRSPAFRRQFELGGDTLARPPRGYDPAHPLIEDIKRKDFVASRAFDDATACGTGLLREVERGFVGLAPMVDYLCAALDLEF